MSDTRLEALTIKEEEARYESAVRINFIRMKNYKFFHDEFTLPVDGKNLLSMANLEAEIAIVEGRSE